ncbi:unnamed protein product [Cuscuta epithymum]|uniref:Protein kinase domain-containing protein n=2 Tax=Cuscuta epithymum TaxID=186058 RepID=A0AAV0G349_9ASTE|nr:unnamed protein product [Cuscuta epithymum]
MEQSESEVSGHQVGVESNSKKRSCDVTAESNSEKRQLISGSVLNSDEEEIRQFIEKLKKVDAYMYVFRREKFKCPSVHDSMTRSLQSRFDKTEKIGNPIEGIDLGSVKHFSYDKVIDIIGGFSEESYVKDVLFARLYRGKIDEWSGPQEVIVKKWNFYFPINRWIQANPTYFAWLLEFMLNPLVSSHHNMAKLIGFSCDKTFALVYDVNLKHTLWDLIPLDTFSWSARMKVAKQVVETLKFFHQQGITFCTFVAPNISVDEDYNIKLFEFGRSAMVANEDRICIGAYNYFSPEAYYMEFKREWCFTTDVYTLGLFLLELLMAKCVEMKTSLRYADWAANAYIAGKGYRPYDGSVVRQQNFLFHLGTKCCKKDPMARPNMVDVFDEFHEFLAQCNETKN